MKQYTKDLGRVSLVPSGMWDIEKSYDRLSLVYHSGNKFAYVAKQDVPANTSIDNKEYWQPMNVTGYADNNFINLSTVTKDGTITVYDNIGEAIKSVASDIRKPGAVLSFYNTNEGSLDVLPEYELWQFNSTDVNDWENPDSWNNIYFNKNVFVGWYINENILYKYQSTPSVGQYAYVGVDFYTSLLYQCRADGVWTNTNTTIGDFISIIVKGNVEVGPNGNWWNNGVDTGFPASVDSEVVIDKVVNNVLEKLKDGITTDKITTNTIEAEEIDEEKNLNIIADKIISDAEIVIGNSIINNNKITTDRLSINNKTADDILLGDGSTTSLSEIKEAYLPLNVPEGGKVITIADDNGIKIVKNNDTAYNIIRNKYINMYGESSAGGSELKFNRSINKVNDLIYGYIDKDVDEKYNLEVTKNLTVNPSIIDRKRRTFDDGAYLQIINQLNLNRNLSEHITDSKYYYKSDEDIAYFTGRIYNNDSTFGNAATFAVGRKYDGNHMTTNIQAYDDVIKLFSTVINGDLQHRFSTRTYSTGKTIVSIGTYDATLDADLNGTIRIESDYTKESGGIGIVGKTSNDVIGAAYNTLHIGPDNGTVSYSNIAPIVYNETDKKWYIPKEFIKDDTTGNYLPLSGGDMNDGANINLSGTGALHFSNIDADNILNVDSSMIHLEHKENDENTVTEENTIDIGNKTITIYSKDNIEGNDGNTQITANGVTTNGTIKGQDINAVSIVKGALIIKEGGTDKQILMADGSVKIIDEVVGKYLPLAGGDMDETANISMTNGDITITNSNENSSVIHNGLQSTYVASNNNKTNTVDIDNTGIRLTENNSNSSENNSETFISATNITYTGTNYKTVINDEDGIEVRSLSNDYYSTIRNGQISVCNNNGNSSTFDTSGLNISLHDDTLATLTDTELNLNDATVLNAEGLTLSAAKFTNSTLSLGNDAAHISTTDIKLADGGATFSAYELTLSGDNVKLTADSLNFNTHGSIYLTPSKTATSSNAAICWDYARENSISIIPSGMYLRSKNTNLLLNNSSNVSPTGCINIYSPIGIETYNAFLDFIGNNSWYNMKGLFFSDLYAFTEKGITINASESTSYKNAILRNRPYGNIINWDDKYQYTIGPKDTSFDTEYEAVAPLVQDTTDPSKWTIPSEYLPDTSTNKDSVELYIPKFIESVKGQQIDLYFDNVSSEFNEYNSYPTQVRTLGSDSTLVKIEKNHYRCNPSQSDVFFVEKYDNTSDHNILFTKTFTNVVVNNNPTGLTKNICIMGDGFISETYMMAEIKKLFDNAALGTINLIGTKSTTLDGTTYTHEGRKDWDWTHYLDTSYGTKPYSGSTNAFVVDNEINFQKYMSTYFSELTQNIDYFVICMSTKEVMYGVSDDIITSVIENTKQFVDILLSSDKGFPECKIAILLQPVGPYNSNNGNINIDIYQSSINKLNKALIEAFDAGNYNTHVTTSAANLFINRYDGYDYKDITVDEYSSRTVRQYKNLPYLSEIGARQYGKGIYNKLRSFIDGNL